MDMMKWWTNSGLKEQKILHRAGKFRSHWYGLKSSAKEVIKKKSFIYFTGYFDLLTQPSTKFVRGCSWVYDRGAYIQGEL